MKQHVKHPTSGGTWIRQPDGSLKPEDEAQKLSVQEKQPELQQETDQPEQDSVGKKRWRKGE
jgi:hypothetical protein